jgi:hypothetical protein
MPERASSRSLGTRRAHPSAKFTSRAISGPHPVRRSPLGPAPLEGRAPHARMEMLSFHPGISPLGHPSWAHPLGGAGSARPHGNALAPPGHLPARPTVLGQPPLEGRAPHARMGMLWLHPGPYPARPFVLRSPPWRGGLRTPAWKCLGSTPACPRKATGRPFTLWS